MQKSTVCGRAAERFYVNLLAPFDGYDRNICCSYSNSGECSSKATCNARLIPPWDCTAIGLRWLTYQVFKLATTKKWRSRQWLRCRLALLIRWNGGVFACLSKAAGFESESMPLRGGVTTRSRSRRYQSGHFR